jgi:hypothetical protein
VVVFENDAFELGFGYPDKWHMFIRRQDFHKIMRWYMFNWGYREWFGLRRTIWYKLLSRRVARFHRGTDVASKDPDATTGVSNPLENKPNPTKEKRIV